MTYQELITYFDSICDGYSSTCNCNKIEYELNKLGILNFKSYVYA